MRATWWIVTVPIAVSRPGRAVLRGAGGRGGFDDRDMALPESPLAAEVGLATIQQLAGRREDGVRLGRAAWHVHAHLHHVVERHGLLDFRVAVNIVCPLLQPQRRCRMKCFLPAGQRLSDSDLRGSGERLGYGRRNALQSEPGAGQGWPNGWRLAGLMGTSLADGNRGPVLRGFRAGLLGGLMALCAAPAAHGDSVSAGSAHTVVVKPDGTVWSFGANDLGQLGDGGLTARTAAQQVSGAAGFVSASAGGRHTVALKSDGTVRTWGANESGELGNGNTINKVLPVTVPGLTGVTAAAAGDDFSLALKSDGTVWAWGGNTRGQLGNGSNTNSSVPVQVTGLAGATRIAAGAAHALARTSGTYVWAWGANDSGQLGDGTRRFGWRPNQGSVGSLSADTGALLDGRAHCQAATNEGSGPSWVGPSRPWVGGVE